MCPSFYLYPACQDGGVTLTEIVARAFKQHRLWRENNNRQQDLDSAAQLKTQINLTLNQWSEKAGARSG